MVIYTRDNIPSSNAMSVAVLKCHQSSEPSVPKIPHATQHSPRHLNCFDGLGTVGMANG